MERAVTIVCLAGLATCLLLLIAICAAPGFRRFRGGLTLLAIALTLYGGAKHGSVQILNADPAAAYLIDRGSFVTNDYVHVDFATVVIPQSASLYVCRRELGETNDLAWVEHLATTIGEFAPPRDVPFADATNFNWIVFSDWTPGPAVETNGVWHCHWGLDQRRRERLIPLRTAIRVDADVIATPKSKAESERN